MYHRRQEGKHQTVYPDRSILQERNVERRMELSTGISGTEHNETWMTVVGSVNSKCIAHMHYRVVASFGKWSLGWVMAPTDQPRLYEEVWILSVKLIMEKYNRKLDMSNASELAQL